MGFLYVAMLASIGGFVALLVSMSSIPVAVWIGIGAGGLVGVLVYDLAAVRTPSERKACPQCEQSINAERSFFPHCDHSFEREQSFAPVSSAD